MSVSTEVSVAFTFVNDGKEWHGGLNYFRSLFLALHAMPDVRVRPVAFIGAGANPAGYGFPAGMRIVRDTVFDRLSPRWVLNKLATRLLGVPFLMNRRLLREGISVVSHGPVTGTGRLRSIVWIPDFQHMHLPKFFPAKELETRTRLYHDMVAQADRIVVSSEAARRDLETFAPAHAHKARVLRFCALRPDVDTEAGIDVRALHGIAGPFFYMPNQAWAHKNHRTAIQALARLAQERPDVTIVCSGSLSDYRNPQHFTGLQAEIERLGLTERFRMLGVVPYPHIARLMLEAVAVVNPSLFEGWSTTVEEAKALGVPLILSAIDVHREQCQQGEALFFEAEDADGLAHRMRDMLAPRRASRPSAEEARERHRLRLTQFAQTYERIVAELVDASATP